MRQAHQVNISVLPACLACAASVIGHRQAAGENTGKRTPVGGLGTFWDDAASSGPAINIDDLL